MKIQAHGKKYRKIQEELLKNKKTYELAEACQMLKKTSPTKFDASCEVHIKLGIDPSKGEQMIRSSVFLPHGTGKKIKIIAFVPDDKVNEAKAAGAIEAGADDLVDKINKGWMAFDIIVAMPEMMKKLGKIAKTLGQKGLMPNPKVGTVTPEPIRVIKELQTGRIEFRTDKLGIVHNVFGKVSFLENSLMENLKTYLRAVVDVKPSGVKGTYLRSIHICTSMGPSLKIDPQTALK